MTLDPGLVLRRHVQPLRDRELDAVAKELAGLIVAHARGLGIRQETERSTNVSRSIDPGIRGVKE